LVPIQRMKTQAEVQTCLQILLRTIYEIDD
jgi:hypothetical protein